MTSETIATLSLAAASVLVVAMMCGTALSAWKRWLAFKAARPHPSSAAPVAERAALEMETSDMGALIELAAVKERLRRLEAIASGVEL